MTALDCPVCGAPFKEILKDGVLIDVCTECRGVWLDCGELDKLLHIARAKGPHPFDYSLSEGEYFAHGNKTKN